jgi:hypothetical protein
MRPHDMDHLNKLLPVALDDVRHLEMKEVTYQGSWKRGGGRSAWFMLRRKIDRLLEMMRRPDTPADFSIDKICSQAVFPHEHMKYLTDCYAAEDVFAKIEEAPSGEDGTVLAEVRDLRRYLLLVESEMVARGVVATEKSEPERAVPRYPSGPMVALSANYPWLISKESYQCAPDNDDEKFLLRKLYDEHGSGLMKLASFLTEIEHFDLTMHVQRNTSFASTLIKAAINCYIPVDQKKLHVLRISSAPEDYRDAWPRLYRERNSYEYSMLQSWAGDLYDWSEGETKWKIKPDYESWTREP